MSKKYITDVIKIDGQLLDSNGSAGTSGQVLSSTGTATDWVSLSEISGVDGTGTANTVAMWSDADTITDAPITISGNNATFTGNVTAANLFLGSSSVRVSPGGSGELGLNYNTGATGSLVWYAGTTSSKFSVTNAGNATFAGTLAVQGTGDSYFTGNVGIGTTSPSGKLDVTGDIWLNGDNVNSAYYLRINKGATSDGGILLYRGLSTIDWQIVNNTTSGDLGFYSYGTSSQVFNVQKSSGNVGIGTTSPAAKLHTAGEGIVNIVQSSNAVSYTQYYTSSTGANVANDGLTVGLNGLDGLVFLREAANLILGTSDTERMRITSAGNVGIGTSSPSRLLDVDGIQGWSEGTNVEKAYLNPTSTGVDFNLFGNNGNIRFDSRPGSNSYINTGNVGIGTTSPDEKLHITDISGANIILNTNTGANNSGVYMSEGSDSTPTQNGAYVYYDAAGNAFKIATGTTSLSDRLTIARDTGNVGIGTTSPDSKLHVVADNSTIATFESIGANANSKTFIVQSGGDRVIFDIKEAVGGTAADLAFELGNSEVMRLADTGNVGIGTTSPDAKLEIEGTGELSLKINNTQYSRSLIIEQGGGYSHLKTSHISGVAINYGQGNAGILSLFNNTTQAVRINANSDSYFNGGNVGIGTTSPGSELEVDGEITTTTITYPEPGALDSSAYNGEIVYFGTQISMTEGKLMVLSSSAGGLTWYLAKDSTTSLATGMLGIALGTTASAGVLVRGIAKNSAWSSFSEGDKLYLSPTGGSISNSITTDTNDFVRIVGYALGGSKIYFCPDNTYIQNA